MRKPLRLSPCSFDQRPFMIIWEVTQACDLACRHCRANAIAQHDPRQLSTAQARSLLQQISDLGSPRPLFIFTGGDPFKRPDIFELIEYGSRLGLAMAISPSATPLLNNSALQRAQSLGIKAISLSLDGASAATHDSYRGVEGSFDLTMRGWQAAKDLGLKLQLNTSIGQHNVQELPQLFELVLERGAMTWSVFFIVPLGRASKSDCLSAAQCEAVMNFIYDCSKFVSVKTTEGHHFKRVVVQRSVLERLGRAPNLALLHPLYAQLRSALDQYVRNHRLIPRPEQKRVPLHLNSGNGFVFISHLGEVYPSGFLPLSAGNVKSQHLLEIYRGSALMQSLRDTAQYEGRCGRCEFLPVCAGSRSRAYAYSGNPLGEDPLCSYLPGSFPYQQELQQALTEVLPSRISSSNSSDAGIPA